jgi:serine phosphatase RsbU (regulator of sigma subunit)
LDFFAVDSIDDFKATYGACICETFSTEAPEGYIQKTMHDQSWIDYVISNAYSKLPRKVLITRDEQKFIFSVSGAQLPGEKRLKSAVFTDITEVENAKQNIIDIHKHTKESIEYAALIQGALIPNYSSFQSYFDDYFAIWHPKDTVGGDIYLFEELRNEDECILMVIDCTGHGVPGAFVTMLVKAIERQINAKIKHGDEIVSPGKLLSVFNSSMKHLLRQEKIDSISNAGFDGAILYYNKRENIIKFAGAETPLFYVEDGELKMIKGSRHSVGYKKSDINYEFKEHIIPVTKGMQFYITTDGYVDQTGGEKGFSFGKKRFQELIENYKNESMADQQEAFLYALADYQDNYERNDDITVIGLKI